MVRKGARGDEPAVAAPQAPQRNCHDVPQEPPSVATTNGPWCWPARAAARSQARTRAEAPRGRGPAGMGRGTRGSTREASKWQRGRRGRRPGAASSGRAVQSQSQWRRVGSAAPHQQVVLPGFRLKRLSERPSTVPPSAARIISVLLPASWERRRWASEQGSSRSGRGGSSGRRCMRASRDASHLCQLRMARARTVAGPSQPKRTGPPGVSKRPGPTESQSHSLASEVMPTCATERVAAGVRRRRWRRRQS